MTDLRAFFCEATKVRRLFLRRYSVRDHGCKDDGVCSSAMVPVPDLDAPFEWQEDDDRYPHMPAAPDIARTDPRWPKTCEKCGREFPDEAPWQVMQEELYRRVDTGEIIAHRFLPPGALYLNEVRREFGSVFPGGGPDGLVLNAVCPGGARWCIDSRANNCTMPKDEKHRCWVRHGDPRTGPVHVDKNGLTCKAGAGSIKTGNWHGFLDHGYFREKRGKA